jgi:hypothetical protein
MTAPDAPIYRWWNDAACRGTDPDRWFSGKTTQAMIDLYCVACPVTQQCLSDAIAQERQDPDADAYGGRGGMTPEERWPGLRDSSRPRGDRWPGLRTEAMLSSSRSRRRFGAKRA